MNKQQAVVDKWAKALDNANKKLDVQQKKLDDLQKQLASLNDEYQSHQDAVDNFASAPLVGMKAMEDQIFANDMAQKQLRLEMLKWEDVNGSIDDVRSNYEKLQGDIEMLRGEQASLRAAGAGSDILGPMQQQIDAMQAAADAMNNQMQNSPVAEWQKQLEDLQRQGEILDLENSLQFDPLKKQIEDLVDTTKELTFDEVVNGIKNEQAAMAALQPQIDSLTASVAAQQAVVDQLTITRDELQNKYDLENEKLQQLTDNYNKTKDAISDVEQALRDMASEANKANSALGGGKGSMSPGAANFAGAAGGGFPDVGGSANIGREGAGLDQSDLIKQFTQDSAAQLGKMFGSFDMLGPLKTAWNNAWAWVRANVGSAVGPVVSAIGDAFSGVSFGGDVKKSVGGFLSTLYDMGKSVTDWIKSLLELIAPDLERIFNAIVDAGKRVWTKIGPELKKFGPVLKNLAPAFKTLWNLIKPLVAIVGVQLLFAFKMLASVFSNTIGPVMNFVIDRIAAVIKIIRGIAEVVVGILSGDWKMAWQGIKDIVSGTVDSIISIITGMGSVLWGLIKGIVTGIVDFFTWLWDKLVGHSIVPDTVNGIIYYFKLLAVLPMWVWNNVLKPVYDFFVNVWNNNIKPFISTWFNVIKTVWKGLTTLGTWVWDNVLKPIKEKFESAFNTVKTVINDAKNKVTGAFDAMKNKGQDFVDMIKGIPADIRDLGSKFYSAGHSLIKQMINGLMDIAGTAFAAARSITNGIIDLINNNVISGLNKALEFDVKVHGVGFHVNPPDIPKIPHLFTGGIVRGSEKGMLAVLGDKGYDEAVIPLNGPWAPKDRNIPGYMSRSGGGEVHLHFYGDLSFPNVTDGSDAETFITNLEILSKD